MIADSALLLSLLGSLLVWSATKPRLVDAGDDPNTFFKRHLLNLAIGLVLCAVFTVVDYRALRAYAPFLYIASCLGLVAVLLVGTTINGAHSWIVIGGGFQIQPSEFAKVALVAGMAVLLAERRTQEHATRSRDVPLVLALAAVPLGLVMLQPDLGTAILVEIGFVTNPKEEKRLKESRYRDEIARAIVSGLGDYKRTWDARARAAADHTR